MKTVALFGGSFNPPHPGHFEMAKYIRDTLGVDEVWFLFSVNWQKDAKAYEDAEHRVAMAELIAEDYEGYPFVMSTIQDELGTHKTAEVLEALRDRFPDTRFVWVMGADSLVNFHTWENYAAIIENFPIAVVRRPGYEELAEGSYTAHSYPHLRHDEPKDLASAEAGAWCFLDNPEIDMSSSGLLKALRAGETDFDGPFKRVVNYMIAHGLYREEAMSVAGHHPEPEQ